jgi:hypothetical protein
MKPVGIGSRFTVGPRAAQEDRDRDSDGDDDKAGPAMAVRSVCDECVAIAEHETFS